MLDSRPLLLRSGFPPLVRDRLQTLQVNLGYLCNQSCTHCHVNAGPHRTELMDRETADLVLDFLEARGIALLDLTGGAPELNPLFRDVVRRARSLGVRVMDRCNLTVLSEPGQEDLAAFLAENGVEVTASLPCYTEETVDGQRGRGVYERSIDGLKALNALGYGRPGSGLVLNLVYNPSGPFLPPPQAALQADYQRELRAQHGIEFNELFTIANLPIARFGAVLLAKGEYENYMDLLRGSHNPDNMKSVMCRTLVSVDWRGYVYDCDFNQMLDMPLLATDSKRPHLSDLLATELTGAAIAVGEHCYGCTAGQGSSCGGALG